MTPTDHVPRYARTADGVHIAYEVLGDGPIDLVLVIAGLGLGEVWHARRSGAFLERLASFSRLLVLDIRGTGLSDHVLDPARRFTLENRMEDVRAVMDAAGSERAVLLGIETGGAAVAIMFATTFPERTAGLVVFGASAREGWAPDYPIGIPISDLVASDGDIERGWGTEELARRWLTEVFPAARDDPLEIADFALWMRSIGGPGDAVIWSQVGRETDVRDLLASVRVPTLVIHRRDDRVFPFSHGRYLADRIPGAVLAELPGDVHMWDHGDDLPKEVERFLSTIRSEEIELDRFLATVLFTDIEGSTELAVSSGDEAWASLVADHHRIVRGALARFRGAEMDTAGDGFFATFDGPARAIRCAQAAIAGLEEIGISIRAGIHTGEVQEIDGKAGGIAVTIGARIMSLADTGSVLVSQTVKDLTAGSGLAFDDAGEHDLKGVPDPWRLYRVAR